MLNLDSLLLKFNSMQHDEKMRLIQTALTESGISYTTESGQIGLDALFPDFEEKINRPFEYSVSADLKVQYAENTVSAQAYVKKADVTSGRALNSLFIDGTNIQKPTIEVDKKTAASEDIYPTRKTSLLAA